MIDDDQETQPDEGEESFAELLRQSFIASDRIKPGDKIVADVAGDAIVFRRAGGAHEHEAA